MTTKKNINSAPNFIIIGAQKSASTFLQECLNDHPDIYLPNGETPFFETPDYELGHIEELKNIFADRSEKCLGIKRPSYIGKGEVPERINKDLPDVKLIAVLRNPIDRAVSSYFHNIKYGFIPPLPIELGMRKIISDPEFRSRYKRSSEIIEFGRYYKYLSRYKRQIQNGNMLILLHEDILSNPLKSIQEAYDFLQVPHDFIPESIDSRPQKVLYSLIRLKFVTLINRFMFDYNPEGTRLYLKNKTLVDRIFIRIVSIIDSKFLSFFFPNDKPNLDLQLRKEIYNLYDSDIKQLSRLINRDLSKWML
jgi:hypothetical protein